MPNRIEIGGRPDPDRSEPARPESNRNASKVDAVVGTTHHNLNPMPAEKTKPGVTSARINGLLLVSLGAILFLILGLSFQRSSVVAMADFKQVFYGARCLLTSCDLYSEQEVQRLYFAEGDEPQPLKLKLARNIIYSPYPPATYMLVTPFAALPFRIASVLWTTLTCATFLLAAFLMWELGSKSAPVASGFLICLFLVGQELLIEVGNPAGLVVALSLIAVWCFLRKKFELVGVLCLAVSLAVKPHESGLLWLYFLLAGDVFRKRAIQTLLCTVAISLPAIVWVHHLSPNWLPELHHVLQATSVRGGFNDPGPTALDPRFHGAILVSLQSALSLFRDDAQFYNLLSYLIGGLLLIVWLTIGVRSRFSPSMAPLALASISALSMLPVYHRQHDLGLLLLIVPACAMLWSQGRFVGRCALFITAGAAILLNNLVLQFLAIVSAPICAGAGGFSGRMLALLLTRPAPIVLLVLAIFYLWVYSNEARKVRLKTL